jgi:lipopolysaccharide transport system permease protein
MADGPTRRHHWGGLVWTLVRTDFKARYHGTIGGFLWALLKPLAMFLVLLSVFSFIFASDPVYKRNLLLGLFLWDFFAEGTKVGIISMHQKGYLLTKTRFPSWIVVLTATSNALITLSVFTLAMLAFLAWTERAPDVAGLLLYLAYIGAAILIVGGISLAGSVLFLRYRDLNQVWEVIIQAGFFLAPVIYPLNILPERFHFYLYLWPPTSIIQFSRAVLVQHQVPTMRAHALLAAMTVIIFCSGVAVYRRCAPRAIEYI